jgi:hypothetical protein
MTTPNPSAPDALARLPEVSASSSVRPARFGGMLRPAFSLLR